MFKNVIRYIYYFFLILRTFSDNYYGSTITEIRYLINIICFIIYLTIEIIKLMFN